MSRLDLAVLVHNLDTTGGMERQARALGARLAARGARVRIVTSFWVDGLVPRWPRGLRPLERHGRLTIVRLGTPRGWGYLNGLSFYELATAALLTLRPPDLLYAIQWTGGVHAVRLGRLLERRVAVKLACGGVHGDMKTVHESEDPTAFATLRRADRLVCLTAQIEDEAREQGFAAEQLVRIPNGVDLAAIDRAEPAKLAGPLETAERVLFVGALRPQKQLPTLLRAFSRLKESRPRAHLLLAGEGALGSELRALARELELEDRVHFLGLRTDVPALLKAAHVFVLPSESEGLSNALLEAQVARVPAVATDIEGNRALATHDREALLVPVGDPAALAEAIARLLEDRALATRLALAGRARAEASSLEAVARRYEVELARLARPRPSLLGIAARWLTELEGPGVTGLVARGVSYTIRRGGQLLLERINATVVRVKRALGLEPERAS